MPRSPLELGSLLWFLPLMFFVIALVLWRVWRRSRVLGAASAAVVALSIAIFAFAKSRSPAGIYSCINEIEPMCPEKDCFIRLSQGRVDHVECGATHHYGSYQKTPNGWTVTHETKEPFTWRLRFSIFGCRYIADDGSATAYFPRRLIPFTRPSWMPDWIQ